MIYSPHLVIQILKFIAEYIPSTSVSTSLIPSRGAMKISYIVLISLMIYSNYGLHSFFHYLFCGAQSVLTCSTQRIPQQNEHSSATCGCHITLSFLGKNTTVYHNNERYF